MEFQSSQKLVQFKFYVGLNTLSVANNSQSFARSTIPYPNSSEFKPSILKSA